MRRYPFLLKVSDFFPPTCTPASQKRADVTGYDIRHLRAEGVDFSAVEWQLESLGRKGQR